MAAANQGSKKSLVAVTVLTSSAAVAMAILAIYYYVNSSKVKDEADNRVKRVEEVVTAQIITSQAEDLERLRSAKNDTERGLDPSMKLFNVALAERNQLAKLIGNENDAIAVKSAREMIEKAKTAGVKPAEDTMAATISALLAEVQARKIEAENNKKDSSESQLKLKQTLEATTAQIKAMNLQLDQLRAEKGSAMDQVASISTKQAGDFETTAADFRKQLDTANEQVNQLNVQNAELRKQITANQVLVMKLQDKLGSRRVDPHKAVIEQPDGKIVQLADSQYCFINIGSNDHVTKGLTFEVFDKADGVPVPADGESENPPQGKASLEVVDVTPTLSRCRIRRLVPGQALSEGDILINLIYDRNTKYKFVVYGNFDIDANGSASALEGDVIRRLITQWGGTLMNDVNVDTDFVVLGTEPTVPETTPDPNDPLAIAAYNSAMRAQREYQDLASKAHAYRLYILNQNTFLYFVGYFNDAKR